MIHFWDCESEWSVYDRPTSVVRLTLARTVELFAPRSTAYSIASTALAPLPTTCGPLASVKAVYSARASDGLPILAFL